MRGKSDTSIAFCWYEPDNWLKVKKSAADADKQDDTYGEWKANANRAIREIRAEGLNVTKIAIKAEEFLAWCHENEIPNDGDARSRFAVMKLQERSRET
jgi:hypothetical protein